MTEPHGVTAAGFSCPTEAEILALIEADQRSDVSRTLDLSADRPLGKMNRIMAKRLFEAWQALEASYHGFDPDKATGDQLTSLLKITGTKRSGASYSEVPVVLRLRSGAKLESGTHFAHVTDRPDLQWTPKADFTAPADGEFSLRFRAERAGAIDTPENSITAIATPVIGWDAIVSSGEVAVGHEVDDDDDARERRNDQLAAAGSATAVAIRSDLLKLTGATSCQVFENYTDETSAEGLPPHSFEAIIAADDSTDDQIAQAIFDTRAAGIQSVGSSTGTAFDALGNPHTERFTRPAQVPIWIVYELERHGEYVGDEAFAATVASRCDAALKAGESVTDYDILDAAHGLGAKVKARAFGRAPAPTDHDELPITKLEIARFDSGRITVS